MEQTYKGYNYNEHGICLNPETVISYHNPKSFAYEIGVAQTPVGWTCSYTFTDYKDSFHGGASVASYYYGHFNPFKEAAIYETGHFLLAIFNRTLNNNPKLESSRKHLEPLKELLWKMGEMIEAKTVQPLLILL